MAIVPTAVDLLTEDHKKVKDLFEKFEKAKSEDEKEEIADQVDLELRVHAMIEEEILYPAIKDIDREITAESFEEHGVVEQLLNELATMDLEEEQFEAKFNMEFRNGSHNVWGIGRQAHDYAGNRGVFEVEFQHPHFFIYELLRFDLGYSYELDSINRTTCTQGNLTGHIQADWAWLANATYVGTYSYRGQLFDWWNTSIVNAGITFSLGAAFYDAGSNAPTIPSFLESHWEYNGNYERRTIGFEFYLPNVTNAAVFNVPKECGGSRAATINPILLGQF